MAIDKTKVREAYANLSDAEIEELATKEVTSLDEEAIHILIDEIESRNLNPTLIQAIQTQLTGFTMDDVERMKEKVLALPCPECGERGLELTGRLIREVKSFIVVTTYKRITFIACEECGEKRWRQALALSSLLGWWGIPWGLFRTPFTIGALLLDRRKLKEQSEQILNGFVINNMGDLQANLGHESQLLDIVYNQNR
ncbi:MAG: hypothetical protein KDD67_08920 [Ignavibacteriae bacterium]|nr:hypothetical protein [Ignavibacteriota bacterium]MCB9216792.1 hypothetical protein [Ignavibacteria bacterium]